MREHAHHTDAQVEEYIDKALALAVREKVPDELRAAMFVQAVTLYSAKQVFYTPEDAAPLNSGVSGFLNSSMHRA